MIAIVLNESNWIFLHREKDEFESDSDKIHVPEMGKKSIGWKRGLEWKREREREREGATEEGKGSKEVREGNKRKGIRKGNQTRRVG